MDIDDQTSIKNDDKVDDKVMELQKLWRYPMKGLQGEQLNHANIVAETPVPFDRCFALAHGNSGISSEAPRWELKTSFHMLMHEGDQRLASLKPYFDEDDGTLSIDHGGKIVLRESVNDPDGVRAIEKFFTAFLADDCPTGPPTFVQSQNVRFGNIEEPVISLINLASVRDFSNAIDQEVDVARFRGNLIIDGGEAWEERSWVGRTFSVNGIDFDVVDETIRCGATRVNPTSFERDLDIPRLLQNHFGHLYCGVYLIAKGNGTIACGDTISVQ